MPLPSLTQSQKDALLLDEFNLQTAEALNPLAATMGRCNASFWNLPDKRLTVVLNTDPDRTVAVFSANSILGTQVNSMLDALALPMYSARVPLVPGPWSLVLGPWSPDRARLLRLLLRHPASSSAPASSRPLGVVAPASRSRPCLRASGRSAHARSLKRTSTLCQFTPVWEVFNHR